jgi:hypothetical protein
MIVVIVVFVTTSTFCSSLFRRGSKLHGVVPKIAGSKHIETPALAVGVGVGSMRAVVSAVVRLEVTVMETKHVVVDSVEVQTGMLSGPTIGFSYPYVFEYVKVAGSSCLSVGLFSKLARELGIQKRGIARAEADEARTLGVRRW